MEIHIIVALSLILLILLFVTWKDRHKRRKSEKRLIQETLNALQTQISQLENLMFQFQTGSISRLQTQISQLENLVNSLLQNNQRDAQRDALAEIFRQEINVLSNVARQADEWEAEVNVLEAEIFRLEGVRRALADDDPRITFRNNPPPALSNENPYWRDLSDWMRAEKQWTCEKCGINLEERQSDLHAHHILGRGFNSPQHLKVVCRACHAEEPGHEFMKAYPEYKVFLRWRDEVN